MIVIENKGLVPLDAIRLMGVSVKQGSNPIGYFGTGMKYAIAVLLRNGVDVKLRRGDHVYSFTLKEKDIRGQEFSVVYMDDEQLGFTTELGKNWQPWMAYRELVSNAMDEGGHAYTASRSAALDAEDSTQWLLSGDLIEEVHAKREEIFLSSKPVQITDSLQRHPGQSSRVFYRSVRAADLKRPSKYTWNITSPCTLTEDRTLRHTWDWEPLIIKAIAVSDNVDFIREMLGAGEDWYEGHIDLREAAHLNVSEEFMHVVEEMVAQGENINPTAQELYRRINQRRPERAPMPTLTERQKKMLEEAKQHCSALGAHDLDKYRLVVVESLGTDVLGLAEAGTIYVSMQAFIEGQVRLTGTVLEEYIHLRHGHKDCSRSMQNFLLDILISNTSFTHSG